MNESSVVPAQLSVRRDRADQQGETGPCRFRQVADSDDLGLLEGRA